jgi:hypothetical protein
VAFVWSGALPRQVASVRLVSASACRACGSPPRAVRAPHLRVPVPTPRRGAGGLLAAYARSEGVRAGERAPGWVQSVDHLRTRLRSVSASVVSIFWVACHRAARHRVARYRVACHRAAAHLAARHRGGRATVAWCRLPVLSARRPASSASWWTAPVGRPGPRLSGAEPAVPWARCAGPAWCSTTVAVTYRRFSRCRGRTGGHGYGRPVPRRVPGACSAAAGPEPTDAGGWARPSWRSPPARRA